MISLVVIAKSPTPGWSKTRLCPPLTPLEAARVAEACLHDTLAAVTRTPGVRRVVALDGMPGGWLTPGIEVIPQRGTGLDERLAAAFEDVGGPAFLIGMDTPQVTPGLLSAAIARLLEPGVDAVLGPAEDGGWWCIGLRNPDPEAFLGIPMSSSATGRLQEGRLHRLGLRWARLPMLRDVDEIEDGVDVAAEIPGSHLSRALDRLGLLRAVAAG